jgi:hypothetical protein
VDAGEAAIQPGRAAASPRTVVRSRSSRLFMECHPFARVGTRRKMNAP